MILDHDTLTLKELLKMIKDSEFMLDVYDNVISSDEKLKDKVKSFDEYVTDNIKSHDVRDKILDGLSDVEVLAYDAGLRAGIDLAFLILKQQTIFNSFES